MSSPVFAKLVLLLSWLALPVVLIWAYDKWVAAPARAKDEKGEAVPGPIYARIADWLLVPVLFAVATRIGIGVVFGWIREIAIPLSWFAPPIGLWLLIDSWILAPRRLIEKGIAQKDPPVLRAAYAVLPILVVAVIVRMISAETLDFSLVLFALSVATGLVWAIDHFFLRKSREQALGKLVQPDAPIPEPGTVDYARSFFPVAFIVLLVRAFIFEPFRIPSDSMMPTLLDGDFIVVNKYSYGLRWPVLNEKFFDTGNPQRGDVVVFRYPPNPSINYIKRLVGMPGDRVEVHDDHLVINGETVQLADMGKYEDACYAGLRLSTESIGEHTHQVMSCRSVDGLTGARNLAYSGIPNPLPACDRKEVRERSGGYVCIETPAVSGGRDSGDHTFDVVPAGHYLMIGDNRDNSEDGRAWGLVPDENLVGKATRIWFNFDSQRPNFFNWRRIGTKID